MFESIAHPKQRAFLAAFAECGDIKKSATLADCSREAHYDWKRDPEYLAAFERAEEMAGDALEAKARALATDEHNPCVKTLHMLLRGNKPEKYGTKRVEQKQAIDVKVTHNQVIDLTTLSDDELKALERIASKARVVRPRSDQSGTGEAAAQQILDVVPG